MNLKFNAQSVNSIELNNINYVSGSIENCDDLNLNNSKIQSDILFENCNIVCISSLINSNISGINCNIFMDRQSTNSNTGFIMGDNLINCQISLKDEITNTENIQYVLDDLIEFNNKYENYNNNIINHTHEYYSELNKLSGIITPISENTSFFDSNNYPANSGYVSGRFNNNVYSYHSQRSLVGYE